MNFLQVQILSDHYRKFLVPVTQHPELEVYPVLVGTDMTAETENRSETLASEVSSGPDSKAQKLSRPEGPRSGGVARFSIGVRTTSRTG